MNNKFDENSLTAGMLGGALVATCVMGIILFMTVAILTASSDKEEFATKRACETGTKICEQVWVHKAHEYNIR